MEKAKQLNKLYLDPLLALMIYWDLHIFKIRDERQCSLIAMPAPIAGH